MSQVSGARFGEALLGAFRRSKVLQIDPRVLVTLRGVPEDWILKTGTISNGGQTCDFTKDNKLVFPIDASKVTDESTITFGVEDVDALKSDFIGEATFPLKEYIDRTSKDPVRIHLYQKKISESHYPAHVGRMVASVYSEGGNLVVEVWRVIDLVDPHKDEDEHFEIMGVVASFMLIGLYLVVAIIAFVPFEDEWKVREALYFAVVTFTTVGYGDFNAATFSPGGRIFVSFFGFFGVMIIGACVGVISAYFIEKKEKTIIKKMNDGSMLAQDTEAVEAREALKSNIIFAVLVFLALALGMVFHGELEDDSSFTDAFYFAMITLTTVGFGDLSFASEEGQILALFYLPFATAVTAIAVGRVVDAFVGRVEHKMAVKKLNKSLTPEFLEEMDEDGSGDVDEEEFTRKMLVEMGKVSAADVRAIKRKFQELDTTGDGALTKEDLLLPFEQKADLDVSKLTSSPVDKQPTHPKN